VRSGGPVRFSLLCVCPNEDQKVITIQLFTNKNAAILLHWLSPNPVLILNFWSDLQSVSNTKLKQLVIVRVQSNANLCNALVDFTCQVIPRCKTDFSFLISSHVFLCSKRISNYPCFHRQALLANFRTEDA